MKVKALNYTFIKNKYFLNFIFYFLEGFEFFFEKSEKNIWIFCHLQSKKDYDFWQFSINPRYLGVYGKLRNHSKIAPGGLCKWQNKFLPSKIFLEFDKTLTANNFHLKTATPKNYHIFGILRTSASTWWYPGWGIVFQNFEKIAFQFPWFSMFLAPWSWHPQAKISTRQ